MPNNNQVTNIKKVICKNVDQDAKFEENNLTSNKSDTFGIQNKANHSKDKGKNANTGEHKANTRQIKFSAAPKTKSTSRPAEVSIKVNMMHQGKRTSATTCSDKTMQNHEFETRALIEHCRFLAQQLKKAKETEKQRSIDSLAQSPQEQVAKLKSELKQNLLKYTLDMQEYASKLGNAEQELNTTKLKLDATVDKLERAEKREVELNCTIDAKAKEFASLFGKVTSLENSQRDLAMQVQIKQDSFEQLSASLRNVQEEQIVSERQAASKSNAEITKLKGSIEVLDTERNKCMREIENMNIALSKTESREKALVEKNEILAKQLGQAELKLEATAEKLVQAEKREIALNFSVDSKNKEVVTLSGKITMLENSERSLTVELQQKNNSIEKLNSAVREAQKEKIVAEKAMDRTSEEIVNLKKTVEFLSLQQDSNKREMDDMNAALDKKTVEEKLLTEKSDLLSKKLDDAELKLESTSEKLAQAKKREMILNHSIEAKDKEHNLLSEKFIELENSQEDFVFELQRKDACIEKLNLAVRDGQRQKIDAIREVAENKAEEIAHLKRKIDVLTSERENGLREINNLNITLSKKESEQNIVTEKGDFLSKQLNQTELKLREAKEQLEQAKKREVALNGTIETQEKELGDISGQVSELENTKRVLVTQIQRKDASIDQLNKMIQDFQKEKIANERSVIDSKVSEIAVLKKTIEVLQVEKNSALSEVGSLKNALNKKVADEKALSEKNGVLSKHLSQRELQLAAAKEKIDNAEKREIALCCAIESKTKEFDVLADKTTSLEKTHQGLLTEVKLKQDSIEKLNAVVRDAQKEKLLVERNTAEKRAEEIGNLKKTIDLLTSQRDNSFHDINRMNVTLEKKDIDEKALIEKSELLCKKLNQATHKLDETTKQLNKAEKREMLLNSDVESKARELAAVSNKVKVLERTQKDLTIQIQTKQDAIEKLNSDVYNANKQKLVHLRPEVDKENEELRRLIASLIHERDVALAKLKRQEACIDGLNRRIERLLQDKKEQHDELQSLSIKLLKCEEEKQEWESKFKAKNKECSGLSGKIKQLESTNRDLLIEMQKKEGSIRDLSMVLANWNNEMELTLSEFS